MIRLWLLQAVALLLLLQISSVEGKFNITGCHTTKACWVSEKCDKANKQRFKTGEKEAFIFRELKEDLVNVDLECSRYFIVEPGIDNFVFEFKHPSIGKDKNATIGFTHHLVGRTLTCSMTSVVPGDAGKMFDYRSETVSDGDNFICRFKVTARTLNPNEIFYEKFSEEMSMKDASIIYDGGKIEIRDYNSDHFKGRVPCNLAVFRPPGEDVDDKIQYNSKPEHDVTTYFLTCPAYHAMSHKLLHDPKFTKTTPPKLKCTFGRVQLPGNGDAKVASAKCQRLRSSLCADVECSNCNAQNSLKINPKRQNAESRTIMCNNANFVVINNNIVTRTVVSCSDKSTPLSPLWKTTNLKGKTVDRIHITDVKCLKELDCNDIAPRFGDAVCPNCTAVEHSGGGFTCPRGGVLTYFDEKNGQHSVVITCNKNTGEWKMEYDGKTHSTNGTATTRKLACVGARPVATTTKPPGAARAGDTLLIVSCSVGAMLLLLLLLLLIYCLCCKRKEKPKEQPKTPVEITTPQAKTDSSAVEVEPPVSFPAPLPDPTPQLPPTEPEGPAAYSGKRVQFELLREIEPYSGLPQEFSARDMTDSSRSKASQMSQVGGTTDGANTVTGARVTEQTTEVSKTVAPNDESRSDVSHHSNSSMGDGSQTGGAGNNTPPVEDAKKKKLEKGEKAGGGPRVEFRDRVSYETDTKTRDKSSVGSMVTAPEQMTQQIQPKGNTVEGKKKDDPSRLTADKARKTFGQEKTQTTQNTKETNEESTNANRSKLSEDNSRTG